MVFLILCLVVIGFFMWGEQFTPGGVVRRRERQAPDSPEAVASPPSPEHPAGAWRWERWESVGTSSAARAAGRQSARPAGESAVPQEWSALDDHQLNRLLKESSS